MEIIAKFSIYTKHFNTPTDRTQNNMMLKWWYIELPLVNKGINLSYKNNSVNAE